jgi:hypothetical protein
VYVVLNPIFREVLRYAKTRPLDYDYLKALAPASRRLYELLSFQMFAALKHENLRAKYLYSDLCKFAPLTRYDNWDQVKKQLYKIHLPHRKSGYIKDIEFKETRDTNGRIDWIIWYIPGPKAHREYEEFTTRKSKALAPHRLQAVKTKKVSLGDGNVEDGIILQLISFGMDRDAAIQLVEGDRIECEQWAQAWPYQNKDGMKNPPAVLRRFIEEKRRPFPKGYESARKQAEKNRIKTTRESHREYHQSAYHHYLQNQLKGLKHTQPEAYKSFNESFETFASSALQGLQPENIELIRHIEFESFAQEHPELGILAFWDWDKQLNPVPFKTSSR